MKTCKNCIDNDDGLCDRKGILVEDGDHCDRYRKAEKPRMKKHEKKLDITPELALAAYNTLIQFCRSQPASEDGPAVTASCTSTAQVHQIFLQKTGRRYTIRI